MMQMLVQTAQFFLNTLVEPYAWILLARFHLQWLRAPLQNPLGEFIILITHPLVRPARRIIPAIGKLDTASFLLAFLVELACLSATLLLHNHALNIWLFAWVLLRLFTGSIYLLMLALFLEALISWTYPHAPFAPVLRGITYPFLRPLRRLAPPKGGLDFSFLILFFLCYIIVSLPLYWLELAVMGAMGAVL
jgi:YggT family protein